MTYRGHLIIGGVWALLMGILGFVAEPLGWGRVDGVGAGAASLILAAYLLLNAIDREDGYGS